MQKIVTKHLIDHKPRSSDFEIVDAQKPNCPQGGVLAKVAYLSLDPYMGSVLRGRHFEHKAPEPMVDAPPGSVVAQVHESLCDTFKEGDWVYCERGHWQEFIACDASQAILIDPDLAPLSSYVGVLGAPGLTAWASAARLAKIGAGDSVLVNAAAGPVGGTFGQLARARGAGRVVGIAGGEEKCSIVVDQYGFDACIDYKKDGWEERVREALPDGLSVFHENVSAEMAMFALSHARPYARGVLCGLVNAYHTETQHNHPINAGYIIMKRAQLMGLVVYDFVGEWDTFIGDVAPLVTTGDLKVLEDKAEGFEQAPALFERLMDGANIGKALVDLT